MLLSPVLAAPGDFDATTHYGVHSNSAVVAAVRATHHGGHAAVRDRGDGWRKRLSFQLTLINISGGYFEEPGVFLNAGDDLPWTVEMVTPAALAAALPPGTSLAPGVATTTTPLTFLIAAADAEAAKTAILAL